MAHFATIKASNIFLTLTGGCCCHILDLLTFTIHGALLTTALASGCITQFHWYNFRIVGLLTLLGTIGVGMRPEEIKISSLIAHIVRGKRKLLRLR